MFCHCWLGAAATASEGKAHTQSVYWLHRKFVVVLRIPQAVQQQIRAQKVCSLTLRSITRMAEWGRQSCTPPFPSIFDFLQGSTAVRRWRQEKLIDFPFSILIMHSLLYLYSSLQYGTSTSPILAHHSSRYLRLFVPLVAPFRSQLVLSDHLHFPLGHIAVWLGHPFVYCLADTCSNSKSVA